MRLDGSVNKQSLNTLGEGHMPSPPVPLACPISGATAVNQGHGRSEGR
jgi:hypothetical protein